MSSLSGRPFAKSTQALLGALWLAGAIVLLAPPSAARAGTIAVVSCRAPSGAPAPTEGWEEGWTGAALPYAGDINSCGSGGSLSSYVGDQTAQPSSSGPYWQYTPPSGYKLAGGWISARFVVPDWGAPYTGAAGMLGPKFLFDGADFVAGLPGGAGKTEGVYPLDGHTGGDVWIYAFCEPPDSVCPKLQSYLGYWALAEIKQATIELSASATPQAGGFGGALLEGSASGTAHLHFSASEAAPGPGIYSVAVSIDGQVLYQGTPDGNEGRCQSVGRDPNGALEFLYAQPCPLQEQVDVPIDTTALPDGHHELRVTVTDAAGVAETVYDGTITTANRTTVSALLDSPPSPPLGGAQPTYAIELDKRTAELLRGVTRTFRRSSLTLSGQVRDAANAPVPGVTVSVLAQEGNQPAGSFASLSHTTTDATGRFLLHVPKGPSRLLRVVSGSPAQAASAGAGISITETVSPNVSLRVRSPGGARLTFSGRLAISPLGRPRPLVIIETPVGSRWEAVGVPVRVGRRGTYRYVFQSSPLTLGRSFAFRAETPQTGLWREGVSRVRRAVVR